MNIICFEDEYLEDTNIIFLSALEMEIPNNAISSASSVEKFENLLKKIKFDIYILDIMASEDLTNFSDGKKIHQTYVGLELVKRIRYGYYQNQNKEAPIFLRSARARELKVINIAKKLNVKYIMVPGRDDFEIINTIKGFVEVKI